MANILVAIPYRRDTLPYFIDKAHELADRLNGNHNYEVQMWANEAPCLAEKYGPNAWARNAMINKFLKPEHDYVFWPDVDIVDYPADIVDQLGLDSGRIVAPVTFIEGLIEGGWFYDTGGFWQNGHKVNAHRGIINPDNLDFVPMTAVGCNAIVPAWLYRKNIRYLPENNEVEHVSLCRQAMECFDVQSYAAVNVKAYHAYYPHYGLEWH